MIIVVVSLDNEKVITGLKQRHSEDIIERMRIASTAVQCLFVRMALKSDIITTQLIIIR